MPYPNEHAARVLSPSSCEEGSFRRKSLSGGVSIILCRVSGDKMRTQSYRFDKSNFTSAEAKTWLKDHDVKYTTFEAASG